MFGVDSMLFRKSRFCLILLGIALLFSGPVSLKAQGTLTSVTVTPGNSTVGVSSIHAVSFTTVNTLPSNGRIVLVYPAGFDISGASIASSGSMDGSLGVTTGVNTIILTRSGGTDQAGTETETVNVANVANHTTSGSYTMTVRTEQSDGTLIDSGTSSSFTINPGSLDEFSVTGFTSPQTAGNPFTVTITALDAYNNQVTSFTSIASLSDLTGTISPAQTTNFTAGQWSGNVTITETHTTNTITATSGGKAGTSSSFRVDPAVLNRFEFGSISSPQTAGSWFSIAITAKDAYNNVQTGFSGTVTLSEKTGTVEVQATGTSTTSAFTAGVWTGNIQITQKNTDIQLLATGSGQSGTSGYFNVNAANIDHFEIAAISDQSAGTAFLITVTAKDGYNNTANSFSGTVSISDLTGTITPGTSGGFTSGVWTGNVTVVTTRTGDQITVTRSGGSEFGTSNAFNVTPSSVDHFVISTIPTPQTAGSPFSVTVTAQDAGNNTVNTYFGTANLTDKTGTATPKQITFSAGVWTGPVTITKDSTNNEVTVTGSGKSRTSNFFDVNPGTVSSFRIDNIASPKTAGTAFTIVLTALDANGNKADGFTGTVSISDGTGTITPTMSGSFTAGTRNQSVTITRAQNDVTISVNDGSGHSQTSNFFNITHGSLNHFDIGTIATQATGLPFSVTVTAHDANHNTVASFTGSGNTVNITHSGSGSISPTVSTDFTSGIWVGNLTIAQTQASDRVTATRTSGGSQSGQSNAFNVLPSSVDHFVISSIGGTQTAGSPFAVTITAQDAGNNTVTTFTGTVNLVDETGSGLPSPSPVTFSSGVWSGNMTITTTSTSNTLTVTGVGKSGTSNTFNVVAAGVSSFEIALIASPQAAGTGFAITLRAKDSYNNIATGFTGTVSISDATGTVSPTTSGLFSAGVRTETITISRSQNDVTITVNDGSHTGTSNLFNVIPGAVDHFVIQTVGDQVAGVPFTLSVRAEDVRNNVAAGFSGTVTISDGTGTIRPSTSGSFTSGLWSGGVTVYDPLLGDHITVTRVGGSEIGTSNSFNVYAPPGIQIVDFASSRTTVTSGQAQDWTLRLAVQNLASSSARLDSLRLRFMLAGSPQTDYSVVLPTFFEQSGTAILAGGATDTLVTVVSQTGSGIGDVTVQANLYCLDNGSGRTVTDNELTGVTVQDSAQVVILDVVASQPEVTVGQTEDWTVRVVVVNAGGSDVTVNSGSSSTNIAFQTGTGWTFSRPTQFEGGGWILSGGERDTLVYTIQQSGTAYIGSCLVHATIGGVETNTGRTVSDDTQDRGAAQILLETAAALRVIQALNLAPNAPYVDRGQSFSIRFVVENTGDDAVHAAQINLASDGSSLFPSTVSIGVLPGHDTVHVVIPGVAGPVEKLLEIFNAGVEGWADNTGVHVIEAGSTDDTARVVIQNPAVLSAERVVASKATVLGGQADPWTVKVAVRNTGRADLILDIPQAANLSFFIGTLYQTDYQVTPPTSLKGGGLRLVGGIRDTLIYTVTTTGKLGGTVEIRAQITGVDRNTQAALPPGSNSTTIVVQAETSFRIISTRIQTIHRTEAGNGYVNTSQAFQVVAVIENGLAQTVKDIAVDLTTSGSSQIVASRKTISRMTPMIWDSVRFDVNADDLENTGGETFATAITMAKLESSGLSAPVGPALDSSAIVFIQNPADLTLSLGLSNPSGQVSTDQTFTLRVILNNHGTGDVDHSGIVRITLPQHYTLLSPSDTTAIHTQEEVVFSIKAPSDAQTTRTVYVTLDSIPLQINTGTPASVREQTVSVDVTTVQSSVSAAVSISSPPGAADGIVSSGQLFVVKAVVSWVNAEDITAEISLPTLYSTSDNLVKSITAPEVYWQVMAPDIATGLDFIQIIPRGMDALQEGVEVEGSPVTLFVTTVNRTDLALHLSIVSPPDAVDGSVSLGQEFVVRAHVDNMGDADTTGATEATLNALPTGYTSADALTRTLVNGEAFWTIKAPLQPRGEAVNIEASLTRIPLDVNTGRDVHVSRGNDAVPVTTEGSWLAVWSRPLAGFVENSVVPGQSWVKLLSLEMDNRGISGANRILVKSLSFDVQDRIGNSLSPASSISNAWVVNESDTTEIYGTTDQIPEENPVSVELYGLQIPTDENARIVVCCRMADTVTEMYFQIAVPGGDYFEAVDPNTNIPVSVNDPDGNELEEMVSDPKRIFNPAGEILLMNFPNPFGEPGKETTTILYYLPEESDVFFRIYTLLGEPVWSRDFQKEDPQGAAGMHSTGANAVVWDGKNNRGVTVLNGVYILVMKTGSGEILKTKIAFVK